MTFFCLYAKGRWSLFQPLQKICNTSTQFPLHINPCGSYVRVSLLPHKLLHQTLLFPHITIPWTLVYISLHYSLPSDLKSCHPSLHPIRNTIWPSWKPNEFDFLLFFLSHFQYKYHTLFPGGAFENLPFCFTQNIKLTVPFPLQQAGSWISFTVMTQTLPGKFVTEWRQHLKWCLWKWILDI